MKPHRKVGWRPLKPAFKKFQSGAEEGTFTNKLTPKTVGLQLTVSRPVYI